MHTYHSPTFQDKLGRQQRHIGMPGSLRFEAIDDARGRFQQTPPPEFWMILTSKHTGRCHIDRLVESPQGCHTGDYPHGGKMWK